MNDQSFQKFRHIASIAVAQWTGLDLDDLPDAVDPWNFYEDGMTDQEMKRAAVEYARAVLEEEGITDL